MIGNERGLGRETEESLLTDDELSAVAGGDE